MLSWSFRFWHEHIKNVSKLFLSVIEVFDYLYPNKVSKAHAIRVSILALLLGTLKVSKFQWQDFKQKRFS